MIAELAVNLRNTTDDSHVFHFAVETTAGLGAWESHDVEASSSKVVEKDVSANSEPVAVHGVVNDRVLAEAHDFR
ncbi:hypothetical protein [Halospeciosus flavus]|uniref:Uncharacterized protein n=1 Tax=Halospeciosus flavus TaxID=3032283 RepID=A0ABD5Z3K0_9EURY|nr:hypothetical protein [Halospeciosus flavus]